jgi:hypothetical protein
VIVLVNEDDHSYLGVEVTGLKELNGRNLELLYGTEKATVEQGEFITRIKPLEVKVFSTTRKFENQRTQGKRLSSMKPS